MLLMTHTIAAIFLTVGLISQLILSGMSPVRSLIPLALNLILYVCAAFIIKWAGVRIMQQYFDEASSEPLGAVERNRSVAGKIVEVARVVEEQTKEANENLEAILEATQAVNISMSEIADGYCIYREGSIAAD